MANLADAVKQRAVGDDLDIGAAELAFFRRFHAAAQLGAHGLLAIADAQHRQAAFKDALRSTRGAFAMHGVGTA